MKLVTTPSKWAVTLHTGEVVAVWADGYTGNKPLSDDEPYVFSILMDIAPEDQILFKIVGRTPSNAARVIAVVAEFPRAAVASIFSA